MSPAMPPLSPVGDTRPQTASDVPDTVMTAERTIRDLRGLGRFLSAGRLHYLMAQDRLPDQVHPNVLVLAFPLRGRVDFVVGHRVVPVSTGEMVHVPPSTPYSTGVGAQPRGELLWLLVSTSQTTVPGGTAVDVAVATLAAQRSEARPASAFGVELLGRVVDANTPADPFSRAWTEALCTAAVLEFTGRDRDSSTLGEPVHPGIAKAVQWMQDRIDEPMTVSDLVHVAGMSTTNFYQQFTRAFGTSPKDYVLRSKVDRAQSLLRETDESITTIAHRLGFSSSQQFGTAFRRYVGMSATRFRAHASRMSTPAES